MRFLTIRGIPIRLHSSFLLLGAAMIGWILLSDGLGAAAGALALAALVFGSVGLHELGHALVGRLFGVRTRDITLYPFGGVARMQATALAPWPELAISAAGPAVNLVLAAVALGLQRLGVPLAGELLVVNLGMALFNLLPAFPMDGGRVLRAVLSLGRDPLRATRLSMAVGRVFGWAFIGLAIPLSSLSLALVGGFLLYALRQEGRRLDLIERGAVPAATWTDGTRRDLPFGHPVR
ncbi:MAG: site-2 protease family protein [Alphaproteobacteria bacterium]|nr:site-2 protease family protein [Alphaproteobacteria bacterium]